MTKLIELPLGNVLGTLRAKAEPTIPKRARGRKLLKSAWNIGLEYEFENVQSVQSKVSYGDSGWEMVEDQSLREYGKEFKFAGPAKLEVAESRIDFLSKLRLAQKYKTSARTSLHVHMDMRLITMEQFQRIMAVYALVEPALFTYVGTDRELNIYCVPYYRADMGDVNTLYKFYQSVKGMVTATERNKDKFRQAARSAFRGGTKYSALNYKTLISFGSLEFRHAQALGRQQTYVWVNLLMALCHYGAEAKSVQDIIETYCDKGAIGFCKLVFGNYYASLKIRDLNTRSGTTLQGFNDQVDVISIAERAGGILPILKADSTSAAWGTTPPQKVKRRNKRKKMKAKGEYNYRTLMNNNPEG